ncbi:hypothetical protein TNCT_306081, partial [Trichonephila clavata]
AISALNGCGNMCCGLDLKRKAVPSNRVKVIHFRLRWFQAFGGSVAQLGSLGSIYVQFQDANSNVHLGNGVGRDSCFGCEWSSVQIEKSHQPPSSCRLDGLLFVSLQPGQHLVPASFRGSIKHQWLLNVSHYPSSNPPSQFVVLGGRLNNQWAVVILSSQNVKYESIRIFGQLFRRWGASQLYRIFLDQFRSRNYLGSI